MAESPTPGKTVYVVATSGLNYDPPLVWGVYSTLKRATTERRAANVDEKRTPGTMGAFRIYPRQLDQEAGR